MASNEVSILSAAASLRLACATTEQYNKLIPIVIAQYAALNCVLPSTAVGNIQEYIVTNNVDRVIGQTISAIGKTIVVDYAEVRAMALQYYKFRYAMCHGGFESLAFATAAFEGSTGDLVSQKAIDALKSVSGDVKVSDGIRRTLYQLNKAFS
jgi:hypothetical protein